MIYLISIFAVIVFFIENRLAVGKQIHIHYVCIILFSVLSVEMFNTLLCLTLLYWFARSLKPRGYFSNTPYLIPLAILSFILLVTGLLSVYAYTRVRVDFLGSIVRNFVIMTLWPILIAYTIPDIARLRKVVYFYAVVRIIEVGVIGMIIYFYYYQEFWAFGNLGGLDISITSIANPRLISIGAPNSNDAASVLLGALGLIAYQLFNRFRLVDLGLSVIAFFAMLFTWTRSVWVFLLLYFVLIIGFNRKTNVFAILFFVAFLFGMATVGLQLFDKRKLTDDRLQSNENAYYRQRQMNDYLVAIPDMHFFWGMYDDTRTVKSKLHIRGDFSSENYTLETFTKHGILAGCIFVAIFIYFIVGFWRTTRTYIRVHPQNRNDTAFVIAVFATFISLFLMSQTSLFRNNLILYVMIGFMSVIKQQNYIVRR
jgi:hypothetical protein